MIDKQQIMPNNVETQHKHMYSYYIGSTCICNIVFPKCTSITGYLYRDFTAAGIRETLNATEHLPLKTSLI